MVNAPSATKPWYKSKTVWSTVLATTAALVAYLTNADLSGVVPHAALPYVIIGLGCWNIVLRIVTTKGITFGSQQ